MVSELLRALFMAGLPVFTATYLLVAWALRHRKLGAVTSLRTMHRELKRQSKEEKKEKKQAKKSGATPVRAEGAHLSLPTLRQGAHAKWLAYGGGFYGVVGLLTWAVVELRDLWSFFTGFESLAALLQNFGLNTLINLLIGAVTNFVEAIAWPAYWLSSIHSDYIWLWFLAAYGAYWAAARFALQRHSVAQATPGAESR
jgi:hypothetical protein